VRESREIVRYDVATKFDDGLDGLLEPITTQLAEYIFCSILLVSISFDQDYELQRLHGVLDVHSQY
jgi:hypothetical protein